MILEKSKLWILGKKIFSNKDINYKRNIEIRSSFFYFRKLQMPVLGPKAHIHIMPDFFLSKKLPLEVYYGPHD